MSERMLVAIGDDGDAADPVAIDTHDNIVEITGSDGHTLRLDRTELRAAIDDTHKQAA